jgi:hypothetical protein
MKIKNIVKVLLIAFILASCAPAAKVIPTEAAILPSTFTPVPLATITPTSIPTINVEGQNIPDPKFTNPEFFDTAIKDSPIAQFINAVKIGGIQISDEQIIDNLEYTKVVDVNGEIVVFATYKLILDSSSYEIPILIASQNKANSQWLWLGFGTKEYGNYKNILFGTALNGLEKYHRNPVLQKSLIDNFSLLRFEGQLNPAKVEIQPERLDNARAIQELANKNNVATHLIPGVRPRYFPDKLRNSSEDEILSWLNWFVDEYINLIPIKQDGQRPTLVSFCSEAFYLSPTTGKVQVYTNDKDNPLYKIYGENWMAEVYSLFVDKASAKGLVLGKDYRLVYTDSLFIQWRANRQYSNQFISDLIQGIAEKRHISPNDVQLDVAIELHVSYTPKEDFPYVAIPTDTEMEELISDLRQTGVKEIHIAEMDVKSSPSNEQKIEDMARLINTSIKLDVKSIELWNSFHYAIEDNVFSYGSNGIFNPPPAYERTLLCNYSA